MRPPPVDEADVAAFVARRFPRLGAMPVVRLPDAGTVNAIYRIGSDATLRVPLDLEDDTLERMREGVAASRRFAEVAPVPAPSVIAFGDDGLDRPWSLQTWIPGSIATPTGCDRSDAIADDLVDLIRTLRGVPTEGRTFSGEGRGGDLRDHDAWMETCFGESAGLLDVAGARSLWERLRGLPRSAPDAMTHGDLIPFNLVLRDGRLAGVLDTGGFGPADPALDLVAAWHLFDGERRRRIRDALGASGLEWRRGAAWALEQAMGLVWYYRSTLPAMSTLGRTTISRLLRDPEL